MTHVNFIKIGFAIIMFLLLLVLQIFLGKAGHLVASFIPYQQIDPYNSFAEISIHHASELVIGLLIILLLSKVLNLDFLFGLGDKKKGIKYLTVFTAIFILIAIGQHVMMLLSGQLPGYNFPLDTGNVLGTLGFQLFLSGSAEEIVFRALPIVLLTFAFGKNIHNNERFSVEIILASLLFAFAHVQWSLTPFNVKFDTFQIFYAFAMGIIQGIAYVKTKSILYPILMHSISNVLMVGVGYVFTLLFS